MISFKSFIIYIICHLNPLYLIERNAKIALVLVFKLKIDKSFQRVHVKVEWNLLVAWLVVGPAFYWDL